MLYCERNYPSGNNYNLRAIWRINSITLCFIEKLPYENTLCFIIISTFINARNILIYITLSFTACGGARNTGSKNISEFVCKIYQIFSLARDRSNRVTWLNVPRLNWGIFEWYSPIFKLALAAKNIWRINTIASIWRDNMGGYSSLDIICFSKLTGFLELRSQQSVGFSEQIMCADKCLSIFSRQ